MLHVSDTSALLGIDYYVQPQHYNVVLDLCTDAVLAGTLTWPDEVLRDLERLARGETLYTWAKAVHSDRSYKSAAWKHSEWVMHKGPELLDSDEAVLKGPFLSPHLVAIWTLTASSSAYSPKTSSLSPRVRLWVESARTSAGRYWARSSILSAKAWRSSSSLDKREQLPRRLGQVESDRRRLIAGALGEVP